MSDAEQDALKHALLVHGANTAQRVHDVLMEADDLRAVKIEVLIIGCIMHVAGLAKHDDLNLDDFLAMCATAHQDVSLTKGSALYVPDGGKPS